MELKRRLAIKAGDSNLGLPGAFLSGVVSHTGLIDYQQVKQLGVPE